MTQAILDLSDATTNSSIHLAPAGAALLGTANSISQYSTSAAAGDTVLRGQAGKKLYLQSGASGAAMTILDNANIGIGTNDPQYLLDVFSTNTSVNNIIRIRAPSQRECALFLDRPSNNWTVFNKEDGFGTSANNLSISSSASSSILDIKQNGNIGIANTNPDNIFQVGSGARLRISNGQTDYSIIGTNDTDGANNTRIVLNGSTRSVDTGDIHYRATTATGDHRFYTKETTERLTIRNNGDVGIGVSDPISRLSILSDYNDLATGFSIDARDGTNTYNLRLYAL